MVNESIDFAIIGAGLTGLSLGRQLRRQFPERSVHIFEKSKGLGGRMATRRVQKFTFDHGAQFIRLKLESKEELEILNQARLRNSFQNRRDPVFCARQGLTQFAKVLAQNQTIHLEKKWIGVKSVEGRWRAEFEDSSIVQARQVLITAPWPQAAEVLRASGLISTAGPQTSNYKKALVLLLGVSHHPPGLSAYRENISADIFSYCDQQAKGVSSHPAFTVVMSADWSEKYFEKGDEYIIAEALKIIRDQLGEFAIEVCQLKKWRYAQPFETAAELFLQPIPNLFVAGDTFGGASLCGALRSAHALFNELCHQTENAT